MHGSTNRLAAEIAASGCAAPILIPCDLRRPDAGEEIAASLTTEAEYLANNTGFRALLAAPSSGIARTSSASSPPIFAPRCPHCWRRYRAARRCRQVAVAHHQGLAQGASRLALGRSQDSCVRSATTFV